MFLSNFSYKLWGGGFLFPLILKELEIKEDNVFNRFEKREKKFGKEKNV
jgi:hypothetical protein